LARRGNWTYEFSRHKKGHFGGDPEELRSAILRYKPQFVDGKKVKKCSETPNVSGVSTGSGSRARSWIEYLDPTEILSKGTISIDGVQS